MALSITMNDSNFNMSTGTNVAYVSTDTLIAPTTSGKYNFRFLVKVTYAYQFSLTPYTYPKTITFTQQISPADTSGIFTGATIFNFSEIYKSIVTPQITPSKLTDAGFGAATVNSSIHTIPNINTSTSIPFSAGLMERTNGYTQFRGVANVILLQFYEMYSDTANGIPVIQDGTFGTTNTLVTKYAYTMWGRGQEEDGVIFNFNPYKMIAGDIGNFLSSNYYPVLQNSEIVHYTNIGKNEYHTLAILNRAAINTTAEPYEMVVVYFDGANTSGTPLGTLKILNKNLTGGYYDTTASNMVTEKFYLFMNAGLENLQKNILSADITGTLPDSVAGGRDAIKSYVIYFQNSFSVRVSSLQIFNVIEYCPMYEQSRLAYMNRFGAWEYITLNKERTDELKVKREYITKPIISQNVGFAHIDADAINTAYPLDVAKQGKMTTSVSTNVTMNLFTDYLSEGGIQQIQDLMMSPQIHLLDGENAKALVLMTSSHKMKREKNRGLFKYELKFNFANPKYRTT